MDSFDCTLAALSDLFTLSSKGYNSGKNCLTAETQASKTSIQDKFFTNHISKIWNSFLSDAVPVPTLKEFRKILGGKKVKVVPVKCLYDK